jgi:hypothetical protein
MKYPLIIFALFATVFVNAQVNKTDCGYENEQSDLGIGVVDCRNHFVTLYYDSLLSKRYITWYCYKGEPDKPACGIFYKPDYGIAQYVCLRKLTHCYEVLVNGSEKMYIPNNEAYKLFTWSQYLDKKPLRVGRKEDKGKEFTFYTEPDIKSDVVTISDTLIRFCVLRVNVDWVEVQVDCGSLDDKSTEGYLCKDFIHRCPYRSGWFKWRDGNKLLIEIYLLL